MKTLYDNGFRGVLSLAAIEKLETVKIFDTRIHLDTPIHIDMGNQSFYFENCIFTGQRIDFSNSKKETSDYQSLQFINCEISNDLFIKDCKLYRVEFLNVYIVSNSFHITTAEIKYISIIGSPERHSEIKSLMLNSLNFDTEITDLDFRLNNIETFAIHNCTFNTIMINANKINRLSFDKLNCNDYFQFWKNILTEFSTIKKSVINEFIGKGSIYGTELEFEQVIFKDVCRLESVPKNSKSSLTFKECTFDKSVYFDESHFYELSIIAAFFKDIVSFNSTTVSIIKFRSVHFDKVAFFNDFIILLKNLVDIGTIRIIKNQLYKTENKIDYIDYNVIEQNLLLNDKNLNLNDKILLKLNKRSNNFGSSWLKAVWFTLKVSLFGFFVLLFVNTFLVDNGYKYEININSKWASLQEILKEWLRFTFSFDLRSYQNYESNGFLLFVFFFFKIFIGYGVYQTIAAFRKHSK